MKKTFWSPLLAAGLAIVLYLAVLPQTGKAERVGINFLGNATAQTVVNPAGVLALTNWNNITNTTYTSGTIYAEDNSGALTLTMNGPGRHNGWNNGTTADGADASLMRGYCDAGINGAVTNVISGFTYSNYTVYIYCQGDARRPGNGGDWLPNYSVNGISYYTATLGGAFTGYVQGGVALSNTNTYPPALTYGNYIEIDNVKPVGGVITVCANADNHTWRSPINAIEIFSNSVATPPAILSQSTSLTNYAGTTIQLVVAASGSPLNYHWMAGSVGSGTYTNLDNGGDYSGVDTATLTISNATVRDMADYVVVITNSVGSATSPVPITVGIVPLFLDGAYPASALVYSNGAAFFTANVAGSSPLSYHWRKDGVVLADGPGISGAITNTVNLSGAQGLQAGVYDLIVTNVYGAVTSSPAVLGLVNTPADGTYAAAVASNNAVAYWRLNEAAGTVANDFMGGHTATYGAFCFNNVTSPTSPDWPGFEASNTGVQTFNGYDGSDVESPAVTALLLNTNTVTLTAWVNPDVTPAANAGLVFQRGNGVAGLNFNGASHLGYNWNNDAATWGWDSGLALPLNQWTFVALVVSPTNATIYMYNTNGNASANFVHNHAPAPFAGPLAIGADTVFTGGGRTFDGFIDEVAVFKRALSSDEIIGLYRAASGVAVPPSIASQPASKAVLPGSTVQFGVQASGSAPLSYHWLFNGNILAGGGGVTGANTAILTLTGVSNINAGAYSVIITNTAGAVTSSVVNLSILSVGTNFDQGTLGLAPLAFWRLNETSGTLAADASGNGWNGTYNAAVTLGAAGVPNPPFLGFQAPLVAASFNSQTGSWVSLPPLNLNTNVVTFALWVKPAVYSTTPDTGLIFCRDGLGTVAGFGLNPGGELGYTWNDEAATYNWHSGLIPPTNQWSFVALTVSADGATVYMFNQAGEASAALVHSNVFQAFSGETRIGSDALFTGWSFNGSLADAAVFGSALSLAQVKQMYINGSIGAGIPASFSLNATTANGNLVLSWPQGRLLEATNLLGPWITNSAANSPYTNTPNQPQKFYRVMAP